MFGSNAPPGPWCSSLSSRANASSKGNATPLIDTTGQFIRMPVDETGNFCTPLSTICLADVIVEISNPVGTVTAHTSQMRSEEHTSELQSRSDLVCRLLLEQKKETCAAHPEESHQSPPPAAEAE